MDACIKPHKAPPSPPFGGAWWRDVWFYAGVHAIARTYGPPKLGLKKSRIYSGRLGVRPIFVYLGGYART